MSVESVSYYSQHWCHRAAPRWRRRGWWGAASALFGSESAPSLSGCERSARQPSPPASPPPPRCSPCCPTASSKLGEGDKAADYCGAKNPANKTILKKQDLFVLSHLFRRPGGLLCPAAGTWETPAGRAGWRAGATQWSHWIQAARATSPVYQVTRCKGNNGAITVLPNRTCCLV